ncbi:ComEC family competence protein [Acetobacteraceae bacterium]|nr:ComEC family competence protein [Acetobacteraceae bacterium]
MVGFIGAAIQTHLQAPFPNVPSNAVFVSGELVSAEARFTGEDSLPLWHLKIGHALFERDLDQGMKPLRRTIDLSWKSNESPPEIGSQIKVRALLHLPSPPVFPGGYDSQRYAYFSGIGARGRALDTPIILQSPKEGVLKAFSYQWENWRTKTGLEIKKKIKDPDVASVVEILICGKEGDLPQSLRDNFSASGLAHILAVAGLHLGMVSRFVGFIAYLIFSRIEWFLLRVSVKRLAALIGLLAGAAYIFFTGAHIPGVRALGVAFLALIAWQFRRTPFSLRSLALVALGFECLSPAIVLQAGFQMSFCAIMALGAGYRALAPITSWIRKRGKIGSYFLLPLFTLFMTSLIAGLSVMPPVLARFGVVQPWFILANLIAVLLMGLFVMPMAVCSFVSMLFGCDAPFLWLMGKGVALIIACADFSAHLPAASIRMPVMVGWVLALSIYGLSLLCLAVGKQKYAGILLFPLGMSLILLQPKPFLLFSALGRDGAVFQKGHLEFYTLEKDQTKNRNRFLEEAWEKSLGLTAGSSEKFLCDSENPVCIREFSGQQIGWIAAKAYLSREKKEVEALCSQADIWISFGYALRKCPKTFVISPLLSWNEGGILVYHSPKGRFSLYSDRDNRGKRPWVYEPAS